MSVHIDGKKVADNTERWQRLSRQARPYPSYLLPTGGTALALFAAGFHGWNDVIHFARARMEIDCVDVNGDKLWEMATIYPNVMTFHVKSAWPFATDAAADGRQWDVVSVDPFFGDAWEKVIATVGLWTLLAKELLTITVPSDFDPDEVRPFGWSSSLFPRSDKASWLVMRRDS